MQITVTTVPTPLDEFVVRTLLAVLFVYAAHLTFSVGMLLLYSIVKRVFRIKSTNSATNSATNRRRHWGLVAVNVIWAVNWTIGISVGYVIAVFAYYESDHNMLFFGAMLTGGSIAMIGNILVTATKEIIDILIDRFKQRRLYLPSEARTAL